MITEFNKKHHNKHGMDEYFLTEDLGEYNLEYLFKEGSFKWIVHNYYTDTYEGSGDMIGLCLDGFLYIGYLGHCSCYGPLESFSLDKPIKIKDFLKNDSAIDYDINIKVENLAKKILLKTYKKIKNNSN